jgi:hypothetical protein
MGKVVGHIWPRRFWPGTPHLHGVLSANWTFTKKFRLEICWHKSWYGKNCPFAVQADVSGMRSWTQTQNETKKVKKPKENNYGHKTIHLVPERRQ